MLHEKTSMLWIDDIVFFIWGFWYPSFILFEKIHKHQAINPVLMHMCCAVVAFFVLDFADVITPLIAFTARCILLYYMLRNDFSGSQFLYEWLRHALSRSPIAYELRPRNSQ